MSHMHSTKLGKQADIVKVKSTQEKELLEKDVINSQWFCFFIEYQPQFTLKMYDFETFVYREVVNKMKNWIIISQL